MRFFRLFVLTCTAVTLSCSRSDAREARRARGKAVVAAAAVQLSKPQPISEPIWTGGLQSGWSDFGWAPHDAATKGPLELRFNDYGGWILAHSELKSEYGGVRFKVQAPDVLLNDVEVRLDSTKAVVFPRVQLVAHHRIGNAGGWTDIFVPIEELNPEGHPFDRVVIRSSKSMPDTPLTFDQVGLTARDPSVVTEVGRLAKPSKPPVEVTLEMDCGGESHAINPLIYGIAFAPRLDAKDRQQWSLGATARRWGGNPTSRYNWELGNAWNTGSDYYFRNINYTGDPTFTWDKFLEANLIAHMQTALTVPTIGFVAKDSKSYGFPTSIYPVQQDIEPDQGQGGNGVDRKGKNLESGPPTLTSVAAPPDFVERWVKAIRAKDEKRGRSVQMYILDNEPDLWHDTHRDLHPQPETYDELLMRTLQYGHAVRHADPDALIAGPAAWGWPAYFGSGLDGASEPLSPDRRAHGNIPLLAWYLHKLHEHEQKTHERILDVLDVHFYPMAKALKGDHFDDDTNALRIRATRSLWDPTYEDESWIKEKIQLIPRLKQWIAENYPGRGISLGEYNFGGATHMSGGLAEAEALGRFGEQGITSAFYWTYPPADSPAFWAFRAYRNYDGQGAHFEDTSVKARGTDGVSFFVSQSADARHKVAVILNLSPTQPVHARIHPLACGAEQVKRVFTYDGDAKGIQEVNTDRAKNDGKLQLDVGPYSINVVELESR